MDPTFEKSAEEITDIIEKNIAEIASGNLNEGVKQLKEIALDFLKIYRINMPILQNIQTNLVRMQSLKQTILERAERPPQSQLLVQEYSKIKKQNQTRITQYDCITTLLTESFRFNDRILKVITGHDQRIAVVIPRAKSAPYVMDMSFEEAMAQNSGVRIVPEIRDGKIVGRLRFNMKNMGDSLTKINQQDTTINTVSLNQLNEAYKESLDIYQKFHPYVFWYIPPKRKNGWSVMRVGGAKGDFAEAYANFFYMKYKQEESIFPSKWTLYDRNLDYFLREGVANVDNVSGLMTADIVGRQIDYAVKSSKASLPGLTQMVNLALEIAQSSNFTPEQLREKSLRAQFRQEVDENGLVQKVHNGLRNTVMDEVSEAVAQGLYQDKKGSMTTQQVNYFVRQI